MKNIFISYSRHDRTLAERLARDLQDAGLNVWIDFRRIRTGEQWREAIFEGVDQSDIMIVCLSPAAVDSEWVRREILMGFSHNKLVLPIMLEDAFTVMQQFDETKQLLDLQITHFEGRYEQAFQELLTALPGIVSTPDIDPADIPNPFKGLEAFQQTDAAIFFGREDLTAKLLDKLAANKRFIAIVGPSGSGKSSLVRAGLIPKIRDGKLTASEKWRLVIFTPGHRPTEALATRLLPVMGSDRLVPEIVQILESGPNTLHQLIEGILADEDQHGRVVLVIDQFEEVFTRASQPEAQRFLDLIHTAATIDGGRTILILTMRADFFDRLTAYPALAALVESETMVIVTDMTPDHLRESIEGPAAAVGLIYDQGLSDRILEDVRQQPGSLPLLQYALKALYERRVGRQLTFESYEAIGGVQRALAEHADSIFNQLSSAQQDLMQRVLLRLVEVSETGEATRRKVTRDELTFREVSYDDVNEIIDLMTAPESRLLIASRDIPMTTDDDSDMEPTTWLEISHEALIHKWAHFKAWIDEHEDQLKSGSEFLKAATDWQRAIPSQQPDFLLRGARLKRAVSWLDNADANALQHQFIETSQQAETELIDRTRRRERHLMQGRFGLVLAIALIAMLGLLISWSQGVSEHDTAATFEAQANIRATSEAQLQSELHAIQYTQSLLYADLSRQTLTNGSLDTALLLALESMKNYPDVWTISGQNALIDVLNELAQNDSTLNIENIRDDVDGLLTEARSRVIRVFTPEERERFFLPPLDPTPEP
jgi:energy-coupling factor transporter ATP-binding protein EcfA2